ncbi:MAG: Minf_1886 family protein [Planctomycetota bacterium]
MKSSTSSTGRVRFDRQAYHFVFSALQHTQERLQRSHAHVAAEDEAHITGQELCEGVRELAQEKFGFLARTVLGQWGVTRTDDIGAIVFELVDRGEMRKTDRDCPSDFADRFNFEQTFEADYDFDTSKAFEKS